MNSIKIENQKEIEINEELTADTSDIIIPQDIKFLRIVWCDNANLIRG